MDVDAVLDKLMETGVSVWLDLSGKLRIDKEAPAELKQLVREHRQDLIDLHRAVNIMNRNGIRRIRLPLGHAALTYPLHANLDDVRWAMRILRVDSMPLVINDEGLEWTRY